VRDPDASKVELFTGVRGETVCKCEVLGR
jgi:hypothetical protein